MSLYIRLQTNFWTNRKTMRLRAAIGSDALWLPIRLWSYAAENQPDGDFSSYSVEELALLVGCSGNAQAMLQALQDAGFMDGMKIHGWEEHNGYHKKFSERASIAANARWEKERKDKKGKDKKRKETSNASSMKSKASENELVAYAKELNLPASDGSYLFDKWEGCGWMNGKNPIKCWRATFRQFKKGGWLPSQKNGQAQPAIIARRKDGFL